MERMRHYGSALLGVLLLLGLLLQGLARSAMAAPDPGCCGCHEEVCEKASEKRYIHQPFLERQCTLCHLDEVARQTAAATRGKGKKNSTTKVRWLRKERTPAVSHWFVFPGKRLAQRRLALGVWRSRKLVVARTIDLPPLASLPELPPDQTPPVIDDLRVIGVERGLFLSATIAWHTDEPTVATLKIQDDNGRSLEVADDHFSREHQLTISELKSHATYRLTVLARDISGNSSRSALLSFSTDSPSVTPVSSAPVPKPATAPESALRPTLFRHGDQYLLRVDSDAPVSLAVGLLAGRTNKLTRIAGQQPAMPTDHPRMSSQRWTAITVCGTCHPESTSTLSHPVDVHPKPGMVVPADYPTLADGRITCMSCHTPHGSDAEFRLIRADRRDLCVGCHRTMR